MSEKMLRIDLTELKTVRVRCKQCNHGVIEVPIDRLDKVLNYGECKFCNTRLLPKRPGGSQGDALNDLRLAVAELERVKSDISIEFEIPAP